MATETFFACGCQTGCSITSWPFCLCDLRLSLFACAVLVGWWMGGWVGGFSRSFTMGTRPARTMASSRRAICCSWTSAQSSTGGWVNGGVNNWMAVCARCARGWLAAGCWLSCPVLPRYRRSMPSASEPTRLWGRSLLASQPTRAGVAYCHPSPVFLIPRFFMLLSLGASPDQLRHRHHCLLPSLGEVYRRSARHLPSCSGRAGWPNCCCRCCSCCRCRCCCCRRCCCCCCGCFCLWLVIAWDWWRWR